MRNTLWIGLCLLIVVVSFPLAAAEHYYQLELDNKNTLTLKQYSVVLLDSYRPKILGNYIVDVYTGETLLHEEYFSSTESILWDGISEGSDQIDIGGQETMKKEIIPVLVPYFKNATKLVISSINVTDKTQVLVIDVSKYAQEETENALQVQEPQQEEVTVPEQTGISEELSSRIPRNLIVIIGCIILIGILLLVLLFRRKRPSAPAV